MNEIQEVSQHTSSRFPVMNAISRDHGDQWRTTLTYRAEPAGKVVNIMDEIFRSVLQTHGLNLWECVLLQELRHRSNELPSSTGEDRICMTQQTQAYPILPPSCPPEVLGRREPQ